MDEGVARLVPSEFEAGGERGDPDFADGRVGGDDEFGLLGFLENNFELPAFAFDVKAVLIAKDQQALFEILESDVRLSLKVFFIEHEFSVHEERELWVVGSERRAVRIPVFSQITGLAPAINL
jgi:hypothetical protein